MATRTTHYGLIKPEGTDPVDIDDLNGNFDIIDTRLKANADAAAGKQEKLTFDETPTSGSRNPVTSGGVFAAIRDSHTEITMDEEPTAGSRNAAKSGGIYTALARKQDTLNFDDAPVEGSIKPVKSGGIYSALAGKQDTLSFDNAPMQGSTKPVKSGGIYLALAAKQDDLTQVPTVLVLHETDYLFLERNGTVCKILASAVVTPSGVDSMGVETADGNAILTEGGDELLADT